MHICAYFMSMILFRKSGNTEIKIKVTKCKKPKLNTSAKGATWDFDRHHIDESEVKMWVETSWGEFAYFKLNSQWYKFRMQSSYREREMNDNLDFGQELNVNFSTKYGGK